jgi:hypothetical protein
LASKTRDVHKDWRSIKQLLTEMLFYFEDVLACLISMVNGAKKTGQLPGTLFFVDSPLIELQELAKLILGDSGIHCLFYKVDPV